MKTKLHHFLVVAILLFAGGSAQAQTLPICEAEATAHCYYIAVDGNDNDPGTFVAPYASINPIINSLEPGDFVYFRGGNYGVANRGPILDYGNNGRYTLIHLNNVDGEEDNLITFKAYPSELPIIDLYELNPEFDPNALTGEPRDAFSLYASDYIKIEGFEIVHGAIHLWNNPHHIWIENNHIHDLYTMRDNNGLILLHFAQNVHVHGNKLHDTYERGIPDPNNPGAPCNNIDHSGCILNTVKSHFDAEHNGCITTLSGDVYVGYGNETSGPFEFTGNDIHDCPARFFIKNPEGESVDENGLNITIEDNYFHGLGYLFYGLRSSNVMIANNLCKDSCSINKIGSTEYPHGESSEEIINEIDGRNITFKNNIFLDSPAFANIWGLGFLLENGVYSDALEDKLKFENNIVFMSQATPPGSVHWNSPGYIFSNSYAGQADLYTNPIPSKIFSRIVSRNNCYVNSLGNGMGFIKQFLTDAGGSVEDIVGYDHASAVRGFGIGGENDSFPTNMNQAFYFADTASGDYSQIISSPCSQNNIGLTDSNIIQNIITGNDGDTIYPNCGDGTCNGIETCATCSDDCGQCRSYGLSDFIALQQVWLTPGDQSTDINQDSIVNARDLGIMMSSWED